MRSIKTRFGYFVTLSEKKTHFAWALAKSLQKCANKPELEEFYCAAITQLLSTFENVNKTCGINNIGSDFRSALGRHGIKGGKLSEKILNKLSVRTVISMMNAFTHESVTGKALYSYLAENMKEV